MRSVGRRLLALAVLSFGISVPASAQEGEGDLGKAIQNPVASLISVPFQNNIDTGIGEFDRTRNTLNIQPVVPVAMGAATLIIRTIAPIITQPIGETESKTGLGDINLSLFFTPAQPNRHVVIPIFQIQHSSKYR